MAAKENLAEAQVNPCTQPRVIFVAHRAKFRSNPEATSPFCAATASKKQTEAEIEKAAQLAQVLAIEKDALHSVRAALEEGVVVGGGVAYVRAVQALAEIRTEGDEKFGVQIVRRALEAPFRQIVRNAGQVPTVLSSRSRRRAVSSDLMRRPERSVTSRAPELSTRSK